MTDLLADLCASVSIFFFWFFKSQNHKTKQGLSGKESYNTSAVGCEENLK